MESLSLVGKIIALICVISVFQMPVHSKYDGFDTSCTTPNCNLTVDMEESQNGTKICSQDIEDGGITPLSKCWLECHQNMKAAEDQGNCFYEYCIIKDYHKDFCKELYGGYIKSTECELARTGEAKFRTAMFCKKAKCPESWRKKNIC